MATLLCLLMLTVSCSTAANPDTVTIDYERDGLEMISQLKQGYRESLGYNVLLPQVTNLTITPAEVKECKITTVTQCYKPLAAEVDSTIGDVCYECVRICHRLDLNTYDHYDFIETNYTYNGKEYKRYAYIINCVEEIVLSDGTYGLLSGNYSGCERSQNNRRMQFTPVIFTQTWKDGSEYSAINGTMSFWIFLTMHNLYQYDLDGKCAEIQLYEYSPITLLLKCNENPRVLGETVDFDKYRYNLRYFEETRDQDQTNMDLYIDLYYPEGVESYILRESVLTDETEPNRANSIHIAHAIDTINNSSALYVDGQLVFSMAPESVPYDHNLYGNHGLDGIIYDFKIYQRILTQRLVNEVYQKQMVEVTPANECYCSSNHPLFLPMSATKASPWEGETCAAVGNYTVVGEPMDDTLSRNSVSRIIDISYSQNNLLEANDTSEYWISGQGDNGTIRLSLGRFYKILALALRVQTLPETLIIKTQQNLLRYTSDCAAAKDNITCLQWSTDVTIYSDLMLINLEPNVANPEMLRSERLELILEGKFNDRGHAYVMKGIELYADCGCMPNTGSCEVSSIDRSEYNCACNPEYEGEYCENCSETNTLEGITCVPCDCNTEGAINQICDPQQGRCNCNDGVTQSEAGFKCNPYFDDVIPTYGPIAGGTLVEFTGVMLNQVINVSIGEIPCPLTNMNNRSDSKLYCITEEAISGMVNNRINFHLTIRGPRDNLFTYEASSSFVYVYHNNPNVTSMSRTDTFYSGGLEVLFGGHDLQGVYKPVLLSHAVCNDSPRTIATTIEQECSYDYTNHTYVCEMPNFTHLLNDTSLCQPEASRTKRQANEEVVYSIWPGLQLDGYKQFYNLSESPWLDIRPLTLYPDPVIYNFSGEMKIFTITTQTDVTLILDGDNLDLAATKDDYRVQIGSVQGCKSRSMTTKNLICYLDATALPEAFDDALTYNGESLPLIQVFVGTLHFQPGYIYYDFQSDGLDQQHIIIIVVVLISAAICVSLGIGLFLYKRRINRKRREQERQALEGFELLEPTNSLQTQVQAILMEENLNEPLMAHIIPASFVTQEAIIGQGHFGEVYRGRIFIPGRNINKSIAIKALKPMGLTPNDVINFVKEALLMKDFNHMNVLQLIGIVYEPNDPEGLPLVITPLMEKGDLKTLISDAFYEFSAGDLLHFGLQVTGGMAYLSNRKFIHRDLRAANCMVDATFIVKIGDFGLSHDISDTDYYRPQDKSKPLPVKWMAIEVLLEQGRYTTQSDVWSFGILLWELMTRGYQPYADVHNSQIKNHIMNGHRLDKPEFIPDVVYDIMTSCWAVEGDARPTFDELTKTISELLKLADGSVAGYQKNYTSPLASVDYMNPQTFNDSTLDDWSTIIPLIKNFGQDYADTIVEDSDSDVSEAEGAARTQDIDNSRPVTDRTGSLTQQLQRMHAVPPRFNDYGHIIAEDGEELAQTDTGQQTRPTLEAVSENSDNDVPPPVARRPTEFDEILLHTPRARVMLASESTIGSLSNHDSDSADSLERPPRRHNPRLSPTSFINSICDSLPTPSLNISAMDEVQLKPPVEAKNSLTSASGESFVYEEAFEVKSLHEVSEDKSSRLESTTSTTFGLDGYLEFQTIQAADNQVFTASPVEKERKVRRRPPPLRTQLSSQSLGESNERKPHKQNVRKSISTGLSGEVVRSPTTPKINLLTKVPVKSTSTSSALDATAYEEAASVWKTPGYKPKPIPKVFEDSFAMPPSTKPNARSIITSDGYLEFNAISADSPVEDAAAEESVKAMEQPSSEHSGKTNKLKLLKRQDWIDKIEVPNSDSTESPVVELVQEPEEKKDGELDSLGLPKPIARITPITRDDYEAVIPPPTTKDRSDVRAQGNEAYINEAMSLDDEKSYVNFQYSANHSAKPKVVEPRAPKPPVPQTRFLTLTKMKEGADVDADSTDVVIRSATLGGLEKSQFKPSPNTRRRNIQESLNAQVSDGVDPSIHRTKEHVNFYDIVEQDIEYDSDYENTTMGKIALYENMPFGLHNNKKTGGQHQK